MPPDGYATITVPEYLLDRLDRHRDDDGGRPGYAETIEDLLDTVESKDGTDAPPLTVDHIDDIAAATSRRTVEDLESRLR